MKRGDADHSRLYDSYDDGRKSMSCLVVRVVLVP